VSGEDALKLAAEDLSNELRRKIEREQGGVPTFFDKYLVGVIDELKRLDPALPWEEGARRLGGARGERLRADLARLRRFLAARARGRFVDYRARLPALPEASPWDRDVDHAALTASQGTGACMHWRGMPLFKTAFDMSIYTMLLWDLRPRTVVELGSGSGSSAVWLADLMGTYGIDGQVLSLDLKPPRVRHDRVRFLAGDCARIEAAFPADLLSPLPRPWLLIEDAHVNVQGVLAFFHPWLRPGDYLIVEDSLSKRQDIGRFVDEFPNLYEVDTRYTDFFGRNVTCAVDSIFVRR
jgi:cephalosporin hydroxylase